ncbi:MAG TPA: hypothetical protein VH593_08635, partial [Ktedonobacteraceae bacterium]
PNVYMAFIEAIDVARNPDLPFKPKTVTPKADETYPNPDTFEVQFINLNPSTCAALIQPEIWFKAKRWNGPIGQLSRATLLRELTEARKRQAVTAKQLASRTCVRCKQVHPRRNINHVKRGERILILCDNCLVTLLAKLDTPLRRPK